jgi:hypothetical protein
MHAEYRSAAENMMLLRSESTPAIRRRHAQVGKR